jgi:hypothetical protein
MRQVNESSIAWQSIRMIFRAMGFNDGWPQARTVGFLFDKPAGAFKLLRKDDRAKHGQPE